MLLGMGSGLHIFLFDNMLQIMPRFVATTNQRLTKESDRQFWSPWAPWDAEMSMGPA